MADSADKNVDYLNRLKLYAAFVENIKQRSSWKLSDWVLNGLVNSVDHYISKNLVYWARTLKQARNERYLVFMLFSQAKTGPKPSLQTIMFEYKKQFGLRGVLGISETSNSNYFVISYEDKAMRDFVAANLAFLADYYVLSTDLVKGSDELDFSLKWLPADVDLDLIQMELNKHVTLVSFKRQAIDLGDGHLLPIGRINGTLKLTHRNDYNEVPHFVHVDGYKGHFIVQGRRPICLTCFIEGHISASCPTPFCTTCRSLMKRGHKCSVGLKTYAAVAAKLPVDSELVKEIPVVNENAQSVVRHNTGEVEKEEGVQQQEVKKQEALVDKDNLVQADDSNLVSSDKVEDMQGITFSCKRPRPESLEDNVDIVNVTQVNNVAKTYSSSTPMVLRSNKADLIFDAASIT